MIKTYQEFWPFYLREHGNPKNRMLHYIGSTLTFLFLFLALITGHYLLFFGMPLAGYSFAWAGHFLVEKNRPATFKYPFWSLYSDFKMYFYFLTGKLNAQLDSAHASKNTAK